MRVAEVNFSPCMNGTGCKPLAAANIFMQGPIYKVKYRCCDTQGLWFIVTIFERLYSYGDLRSPFHHVSKFDFYCYKKVLLLKLIGPLCVVSLHVVDGKIKPFELELTYVLEGQTRARVSEMAGNIHG